MLFYVYFIYICPVRWKLPIKSEKIKNLPRELFRAKITGLYVITYKVRGFSVKKTCHVGACQMGPACQIHRQYTFIRELDLFVTISLILGTNMQKLKQVILIYT